MKKANGYDTDSIGACRGILVGMFLGTILWFLIFVIVFKGINFVLGL